MFQIPLEIITHKFIQLLSLNKSFLLGLAIQFVRLLRPEKSKQSRRCLHYVIVKVRHCFQGILPENKSASSISALAVYTYAQRKSRGYSAFIFMGKITKNAVIEGYFLLIFGILFKINI
ncbi:MAG TPA: hypothetical protein DCS23_03605 [Candidatus Yonathbacteria bacterium]|nr:hypothetical protein [Candidatus Yonathbacteria bacterium]